MDTTELSYMAFDMAKTHGDEWHSALVAGKGGNYHALISVSTGEEVIRAADDSRKSSWLCDYLEAVSPKNILALLAEREADKAWMAELLEMPVFKGMVERGRRIAEREQRKIKLPTFDGYAPHIIEELQAAFRMACEREGLIIEEEKQG